MDPPVDPDLANFRRGVEVVASCHHRQVCQLAGLDCAKLAFDAAQPGGHGCQRRQCVGFRQAAVQGQPQVRAELLWVAQAIGREREFAALLAEQRRILGRPIPGAQLVEADLLPVTFVRKLRQGGEVERDDERRPGGFGQVGPAPFLSGGDEAAIEPEFARDLGGAVRHQRAARLEDNPHLSVRSRGKRFEGRIELGPFAVLRMLLIIGVIERIVARVEEALPHRGDDPHQRAGIGALIAGTRLEHNVLEDIGPDDDVIGVFVGQCDQRAGAADDAPGRDNHTSGKAQSAQRRQSLVFWRVVPHRPILRRNPGHGFARARVAHVSLRPGRAVEPDPA